MTWSLPYWKAHCRSIGRQQLPQTILESNLTSPDHCDNFDLSSNSKINIIVKHCLALNLNLFKTNILVCIVHGLRVITGFITLQYDFKKIWKLHE